MPLDFAQNSLQAASKVGKGRGAAAGTACDQCHRCKVRCSGRRPRCERCEQSGTTCTYSVGQTSGKSKGRKNAIYATTSPAPETTLAHRSQVVTKTPVNDGVSSAPSNAEKATTHAIHEWASSENGPKSQLTTSSLSASTAAKKRIAISSAGQYELPSELEGYMEVPIGSFDPASVEPFGTPWAMDFQLDNSSAGDKANRGGPHPLVDTPPRSFEDANFRFGQSHATNSDWSTTPDPGSNSQHVMDGVQCQQHMSLTSSQLFECQHDNHQKTANSILTVSRRGLDSVSNMLREGMHREPHISSRASTLMLTLLTLQQSIACYVDLYSAVCGSNRNSEEDCLLTQQPIIIGGFHIEKGVLTALIQAELGRARTMLHQVIKHLHEAQTSGGDETGVLEALLVVGQGLRH